jgi:hypothetical protein
VKKAEKKKKIKNNLTYLGRPSDGATCVGPNPSRNARELGFPGWPAQVNATVTNAAASW